MKKIILSAIVVATTIVSCKKESVHSISPTNAASTESNSSMGARVVPQGNMENYIADPTDPQNERINKALYNYMLGMKKVFETNPNYLQQALDLAKLVP